MSCLNGEYSKIELIGGHWACDVEKQIKDLGSVNWAVDYPSNE